MKTGSKQSKNIEDYRKNNTGKGSPFAIAANKAATPVHRKEYEDTAKSTKYNAAMDKAHTSDKIADTIKKTYRAQDGTNIFGGDGRKKDRPNRYDAARAKAISREYTAQVTPGKFETKDNKKK